MCGISLPAMWVENILKKENIRMEIITRENILKRKFSRIFSIFENILEKILEKWLSP